MPYYSAALDQGTTSTRFMIFDHSWPAWSASIRKNTSRSTRSPAGWSTTRWRSGRARRTSSAARWRKATLTQATLPPSASPTSARRRWSGTASTGKPYYNAIVWQDTRTDEICSELAREGGQDRLRAQTGLPLATYFSGPKIKWILDNVPARARRPSGARLLFGNIDTWVIW